MPTHIKVTTNEKPVNIKVRIDKEPELDVKVKVHTNTTISYQGVGVRVSHSLGSKKQKVIIHTKAGQAVIKASDIQEVIKVLTKMEFALGVL